MFVNKTDFDILEKVRERALKFIHNDFVSDKHVCFLNNLTTFLFALSLCDALHSKCLNVWMVWAQAILRICSKWTWILMIWETIRNLSNHVLKPRFMGSAQSDITEPTYGICCPFNIKTVWMFMISENYCLHGKVWTELLMFCLHASKTLKYYNFQFLSLSCMFIVTCKSPLYIYVQCFICMSFYNKSNILCAVSFRYCIYVL